MCCGGVFSITVSESDGVANVEILRTKGAFGDVTVFVFVLEDGATGRGTDFDFNPITVSFSSGEASKTVQVAIIEDTTPEVAESFLVRMTNPTGGATVGKPDETTVTISENDDPYGVFSFLPSSTSIATREPTNSQPISMSCLSFSVKISDMQTCCHSLDVELTVIRQGGVFGEAIVQWAIVGDAEMDLRPTSGALVFQEQESQQVKLHAVQRAVM